MMKFNKVALKSYPEGLILEFHIEESVKVLSGGATGAVNFLAENGYYDLSLLVICACIRAQMKKIQIGASEYKKATSTIEFVESWIRGNKNHNQFNKLYEEYKSVCALDCSRVDFALLNLLLATMMPECPPRHEVTMHNTAMIVTGFNSNIEKKEEHHRELNGLLEDVYKELNKYNP